MTRVVILGSTGSVGVNTLRVIAEHPDEFQVVGLAVKSQIERLAAQIAQHHPQVVAVREEASVASLAELTNGGTRLLSGLDGLRQIATWPDADLVVAAMSGSEGLLPLMDAIAAGKQIALANKEAMVMAGELLVPLVAKHGTRLVPVDSEHSAIFQCLQGAPSATVERLYLTGSGGPLRTIPREQFDSLPPAIILSHPKWRMGPKITVDSATLMNKGLEIIEAQWLFGVPVDRIEVLIHPEAFIHSMVEFTDGAVLAQLAYNDMRLPIQYALSFPERLPCSCPRLDLRQVRQLTFEPPDLEKFPCLGIARQAARDGGTAPVVLNAANETAVQAYLDGQLPFVELPDVVGQVLARHRRQAAETLETIFQADRWAREEARRTIAARFMGSGASRAQASGAHA